MFLVALVCLFVCLSVSNITQKVIMKWISVKFFRRVGGGKRNK